MYWDYSQGDLSEIEPTKIDVACDMEGAFMPGPYKDTLEKLRGILDVAFGDVIENQSSNFLKLNCDLNYKVVLGDNILDSCYQFVVKDTYGTKLLTIKAYDKVLDLLSREGYKHVGSRCATVLNSSLVSNPF